MKRLLLIFEIFKYKMIYKDILFHGQATVVSEKLEVQDINEEKFLANFD